MAGWFPQGLNEIKHLSRHLEGQGMRAGFGAIALLDSPPPFLRWDVHEVQ